MREREETRANDARARASSARARRRARGGARGRGRWESSSRWSLMTTALVAVLGARAMARATGARAMASVEDALAVGVDASTGGGRALLGGRRGRAPEPPPPPPSKKEVLREQFERTRAAEKAWPCAPARVVGDRAAKCAHVRETEACKGRLGSYLRYAYCDEEAFGLQTMFFPVLGLVLVAIASTYALAVAAGTFFVPALEYTATMMKMSPEVAGVTLLALGNGAPDLYAQVSELSEGVSPNLNVVVGSTLGSGFFIATVVLGVVIRAAPNGAVYVGKEPLGAAMGTFAIANIALMLGMSFGVFKMWYALTFFVTYAAYFCITAFVTNAPEVADGPSLEEGGARSSGRGERLQPLFDLASQKGGPDDIKGSVRPMKTTDKDGDGIVASATADMTEYEKKLSFLTVPLRVAMAFTMPVVRAGFMNKPYAIVLGFLGPFFFLSAPGNEFFDSVSSDPATVMVYNCALSALFCFAVSSIIAVKYKTTPLPASTEFASTFAFIQSISWMHFMSDELVMALGALSKIAGVDEEIFGVLFVAWGDGIGDLIACRAVAKAGQVTMAVVACFAGPVFNLLIGLASSVVFLTAMIGNLPYDVKQGELVLSIGSLFAVMFFISQLKSRSPREFELPLSMANAAFGTYVAFIVVYLLCEARVLVGSGTSSGRA